MGFFVCGIMGRFGNYRLEQWLKKKSDTNEKSATPEETPIEPTNSSGDPDDEHK